MLENNFSIFGLVCFLRSGVWTSTVLTAAIGTNWVTTLRISTVHVGDLGSYVTVQLNYHLVSLFASEWICLFCVLAGEGSLDCFTWRARGPSLWPCATQTDYLVSYFQLACQVDDNGGRGQPTEEVASPQVSCPVHDPCCGECSTNRCARYLLTQ